MLKLALRNLLRQKLRTAMTFSAIVFGVVALIFSGGFVNDILIQLGEMLIHSQSGHLQVTNTGFFAEGARKPEQYLMKNVTGLKWEIAAVPGITDVMARLSFSGLLNNGRSDQAIVGEGIEPGGEAKLGSFLVFAAGHQLNEQDKDAIIIGQGVANALKLKPGDSATLALNTPDGAMNTLEFKVVGVFQSFSKDYDARTVKIPLAAARELLDTPAANTLVVVLHKTEDTQQIQRVLAAKLANQGLEVKNWIELNDFYGKAVEFYDMQFGVLRFIVLIMVLLSVTNSVNMTVMERVGEFGTLMAVGNRSGYVFRLVLTESTLLGFFASLLGVVVGIALALVVSKIGIPMPPPPTSNLSYTAGIRLTPGVVLGSCLIGFVASVLASILPALHVSRRPVVEALRQNV